MKKIYKSHLVIPDSHVRSNQNLRHFEALGNLISERKPDVIVDLGDRADLPHLANLKSGSMSEKRIAELYSLTLTEAAAVKLSIEKQFKPINYIGRNTRRGIYKPKTYYLKGNHCNRAFKLFTLNEKALRKSVLIPTGKSLTEVLNKEFGFSLYESIYEYTVPVCIDGIYYSHNWLINGVKLRKPSEITRHTMLPTVSGDSHTYEFEARFSPVKGTPINCLQAGVFFDTKDPPLYYDEQNTFSPSGITILNGVDGKGNYDIEFIRFDRLMRLYS